MTLGGILLHLLKLKSQSSCKFNYKAIENRIIFREVETIFLICLRKETDRETEGVEFVMVDTLKCIMILQLLFRPGLVAEADID